MKPAPLSSVLEGLKAYPFVRLTQAARALREHGADVIDFGVGEPREEAPAFIRQALAAAITPQFPYPLAEGLPELRAAIAVWAGRRFGAALDPVTQIVPTLGAKELVFSLAQVVGPGAVAVTVPGYPVAERGFVLASDEAYSELSFAGELPVSALQLDDLTNVLVLNTLSKRSSVPGLRSGFAAGDPRLVSALKRYRPNVGVAPQAFVQTAAVAAWGDEDHVVAVREIYRAKRDALLPALLGCGLREAGGDATFFLWLALPDGWTSSEAFALALLDEGVVVAPGAYFGPAGEGYVRVALVPTLEQCRGAAKRLREWAPRMASPPHG